jgi:protein-S-isoprenylcysteine O-methyltransferase Ste14
MTNELLFRIVFAALWIIFFANAARASYLSGWPPSSRTTHHGKRLRTAALTFAVLYLAGALLYTLLPDWIAFLTIPLPEWFRLLMVGVAASGLSLLSWALWVLGKNWAPSMSGVRKDAFLVSTGPYNIVRHPIYLGAFILLAALSLMVANLFVLLPSVGLLTTLYAQIDGEEATLIDRFGDEYRQYMKRTPRFIPRFAHEHSQQREPSP